MLRPLSLLATGTHNHIVCYSGGHSSALVAIEVCRRFTSQNVVLLNHDIIDEVEDKDIKRFKDQVAAYLELPITYANMEGWDKKNQFDVVIENGAFKVANGTALCSNRMKTQPFEDWLSHHQSDRNCTIYYGFDKDEPNRIQRRSSHLALSGYQTDYPLALWSSRTIQSTREIGIEPPVTYSHFKHANCAGCLKAGKQHWYVTYCMRPDLWEQGKKAEDFIGYTIHKSASLVELEPKFAQMKAAGIEPTEKTPPGQFWKSVRGIQCNIGEDDTAIPCECVT